jgi:peptidoglycan hydrolase-like amidase
MYFTMLSRAAILLCALGFSALAANAQTVRIGVLGIFHPKEIILSAARSEAVQISIAAQSFILAPNSPGGAARITLENRTLRVEISGQVFEAKEIYVTSRGGGPVTVTLAVPGKISRQYRGTLTVQASAAELTPILTMDLETAVASAVAAESAPNTPQEALKAQAVVARSYYAAGSGRHQAYDFCDLTHCQVLREPPAANSPAAQAVAATSGLVIAYQEKPIATMFTRSCSGRTRTPAEVNMAPGLYPYFAVLCDICHTNPVRWTRHLSTEDAAIAAKGESGRLAVDRRLGWNAVPSNNFTSHPKNGSVRLEGAGQGHGIGLCQRGASAMAQSGATFREILAHYFPNTSLTAISQVSGNSGSSTSASLTSLGH